MSTPPGAIGYVVVTGEAEVIPGPDPADPGGTAQTKEKDQ